MKAIITKVNYTLNLRLIPTNPMEEIVAELYFKQYSEDPKSVIFGWERLEEEEDII